MKQIPLNHILNTLTSTHPHKVRSKFFKGLQHIFLKMGNPLNWKFGGNFWRLEINNYFLRLFAGSAGEKFFTFFPFLFFFTAFFSWGPLFLSKRPFSSVTAKQIYVYALYLYGLYLLSFKQPWYDLI